MAAGYLQHATDWGVTRDAIVRLSAKLGRPFTYGELAAEILAHDDLRVYPLAYAGVLDALARNLSSSDPLWTVMVINAETAEPGHGFWNADYADVRYRPVEHLSDDARRAWLADQQSWCVAAARVILNPLDQDLRIQEQAERERARDSLIDHMLQDRQGSSSERPT